MIVDLVLVVWIPMILSEPPVTTAQSAELKSEMGTTSYPACSKRERTGERFSSTAIFARCKLSPPLARNALLLPRCIPILWLSGSNYALSLD